MTRKAGIEDIPRDLAFVAGEPFRIPKGWVNSALILGAIGCLWKTGNWVGRVDNQLQEIQKAVGRIENRIDGAPPKPQIPLTSSRTDPLKAILQVVSTPSDTPARTAEMYSLGLPGHPR